MIDMIVNQRPLGFANGLLDRMKLLGKIEARPSFAEHLNHPAEVTLGPLQPFDDFRMGLMYVIVRHIGKPILPGGIAQSV
jgi:hypothetical protein